jgi:hypothetical protein
LIFAGEELRDGHALWQYNIDEGSILWVLLRLRGGGAILAVHVEGRGTKLSINLASDEYVPLIPL